VESNEEEEEEEDCEKWQLMITAAYVDVLMSSWKI